MSSRFYLPSWERSLVLRNLCWMERRFILFVTTIVQRCQGIIYVRGSWVKRTLTKLSSLNINRQSGWFFKKKSENLKRNTFGDNKSFRNENNCYIWLSQRLLLSLTDFKNLSLSTRKLRPRVYTEAMLKSGQVSIKKVVRANKSTCKLPWLWHLTPAQEKEFKRFLTKELLNFVKRFSLLNGLKRW